MILVLIAVSSALTVVIFVAVFMSVRCEKKRRWAVADLTAKDLLAPAFNFVVLAPLQIDPKTQESYVRTLTRVLVSDYLRSEAVRRVVDEVLPPRVAFRRDFRPPHTTG